VVPAPTTAASDRRVALLHGCVQQALFPRVNRDTAFVLRACGCTIVHARRQRCCGALHAHSGDLDGARALARANIDAFEAAGADAIVVNAAGCGAMMKEYGELLEHDARYAARSARMARRVRDVAEFLVEVGVPAGAPLPLRVTYDAPCHLLHAQGIAHAPLDLLTAIPDLEHVPLKRADECCGGAGIYGLLHAELGGRILDDKVAAIRDTGADVVVTPNPGCAMQIGAGLRLAGVATPVLHPIELIADSLRRRREEP
jgi:glycolate oxidase iron-sulfur subunit